MNGFLKRVFITAMISVAISMPALAQESGDVEILKQKIAALEQINSQLRSQLRQLKQTIQSNSAATMALPSEEVTSSDDLTAIEQSLTSRSLAVLAPGKVVVEPSLSWTHVGSGSDAANEYGANFAARVGLPFASMVSVEAPYVLSAENSVGSSHGFADPSVRVSKQIYDGNNNLPGVVASVGYETSLANTDFSGFSTVSGGLAFTKNVDPMVLFASLDVDVPFEKRINGSDVKPGTGYYLSGGASLAVTPAVSTSLSLQFGSLGDWSVDSSRIAGSERTVGYLRNNWDFVLSKNLDLSLSGAFGVTDDSEDMRLVIGLPVKF